MKKTFWIIGLTLVFTIVGCAKECPPGPCSSNCSNSYRSGAVCDDGSVSNSTGQGTCSGHGGVNYWTYNCN